MQRACRRAAGWARTQSCSGRKPEAPACKLPAPAATLTCCVAPPGCRFKAEIQWSGEHVVQKYLAGLGRDSLYRQIRKAACQVPPGAVPQPTEQDAIDLAMMEFGAQLMKI